MRTVGLLGVAANAAARSQDEFPNFHYGCSVVQLCGVGNIAYDCFLYKRLVHMASRCCAEASNCGRVCVGIGLVCCVALASAVCVHLLVSLLLSEDVVSGVLAGSFAAPCRLHHSTECDMTDCASILFRSIDRSIM